jgi:Protein of unknown function (DUF2924)
METDPMAREVLAHLARIQAAPTAQLRDEWRKLCETEPPKYNRQHLVSQLSYRVQELAYGGLKPATVARLEIMGEQLDGGKPSKRKIRGDRDLVTGTRLQREWQGTLQTVTVVRAGYEWQGRAYKSLSAVARSITGTRWNGWTFFGLRKLGENP